MFSLVFNADFKYEICFLKHVQFFRWENVLVLTYVKAGTYQ